MLSHSGKKISRAGLLLLLALLLSLTLAVMAQDATRTLQNGAVVNGSINADNLIQVYNFSGTTGQVITLQAISVDGLALALSITDAQGGLVAQAADSGATGAVALAGVTMPRTETYYVTLSLVPGVDTPTQGNFQLVFTASGESVTAATLEPTAETGTTPQILPPPVATTAAVEAGTLETTFGLEVSLTWNTTANLDLEVRDPVGGSLYWFTPEVASGGVFNTPNINGACENVTADSPTETLSWGIGPVPTGSYEVLVYYQQVCDEAAANDPVSFTISITLDGVDLEPIQATLLPEQVFIGSFTVIADGSTRLGANGVYSESLSIPAAELLAGQTPLARTGTVSGTITNDNFFDTYSFEGLFGDVVTATLTAVNGGSLDTRLFLLDSTGNVVASNDDDTSDPAITTTNSAIRNFTLVADGTYTLVATRYGQQLGGTAGDYELTLIVGSAGSDASSAALDQITSLGLPRGDIEIALLWDTSADFQLLVRDPTGLAVYDDRRSVSSGGQLIAVGNQNCVRASGSPISYIYWPTGTLRFGTNEVYEIEVWFQNICGDNTPVEPVLSVIVQGRSVFSQTITGIRENERYLISFAAQSDGQIVPGPGGIIGSPGDLDFTSLNFQSQIAQAVPVVPGEPLRGAITRDDKFDIYAFDGQSGDRVRISMEALDGTLDAVLAVVDADGIEIAQNDDAPGGTTRNSLIADLQIPADGRYYIIATHYGALYGTTIGRYNLTFSRLN